MSDGADFTPAGEPGARSTSDVRVLSDSELETLSRSKLRAVTEQDHYEVLEVRRDAAPDEIERAYRAIRDTYRSESLALYSVFDEGDASTIRARVEEAYRVLSDPDARRAHDEASAAVADRRAPREASASDAQASFISEVESEDLGGASDTFRDLESDVEEETGEFDGAKLRRARLRRGFDLEQISDITKVTVAHLSRIENEEFADLPATVYVRGFVTAYARTIGLDPERVVTSYMTRVEQHRAQPRARFRSRT